MFGTVLGILSALVSAGVGIYSAYQSKKQQDLAEKTSQENFDLQQKQFEYQKELNQTVQEREDNSMQRQVADLKAAGLSPLSVTNGASATPLTSANAPQRDISGIQTALQNQLSAYNDIFNRRLARQQFALQSKVQKAQMYTQLVELEMKQKTAEKQNKLLDLDYTYYLNHPERNLGLQSVLTNALISYFNKESNTVTTDLVKDKVSEVLHDSGFETPSGDFSTYGALEPDTKYAHTLDNENYDNLRPTVNLIAQETKEKFYKNKLKKTDTEDIRKKLYKTDDYLKKHISLENWLKKDKDFILFYLRNGKFEGHKKYFE